MMTQTSTSVLQTRSRSTSLTGELPGAELRRLDVERALLALRLEAPRAGKDEFNAKMAVLPSIAMPAQAQLDIGRLLLDQQLRAQQPQPCHKQQLPQQMLATQSLHDALRRQAVAAPTGTGQAHRPAPDAGCAQRLPGPASGGRPRTADANDKAFPVDRVRHDLLTWSDEMSWFLRFGKRTEVTLDWLPEDATDIMKQLVARHGQSAAPGSPPDAEPMSYPWLVSTKRGKKPEKKGSRPPPGIFPAEPLQPVAAARPNAIAPPPGLELDSEAASSTRYSKPCATRPPPCGSLGADTFLHRRFPAAPGPDAGQVLARQLDDGAVATFEVFRL